MHVDLVRNEWLAGFQFVAARLYLDGSKLRLESNDPDRWRHLIEQPQIDRETRAEVDPERQPGEFFGRLHALLRGDYLFATEPHEDESCPFHDELVVPIESAQEQRQAHAV